MRRRALNVAAEATCNVQHMEQSKLCKHSCRIKVPPLTAKFLRLLLLPNDDLQKLAKLYRKQVHTMMMMMMMVMIDSM